MKKQSKKLTLRSETLQPLVPGIQAGATALTLEISLCIACGSGPNCSYSCPLPAGCTSACPPGGTHRGQCTLY